MVAPPSLLQLGLVIKILTLFIPRHLSTLPSTGASAAIAGSAVVCSISAFDFSRP